MAERQWTPQQADAIDARGGTVLVSAAAGSGKTAVLVQRVIGLLLDAENPVDADRLLVVTFSNAAAAEMRQRIMERIGELLSQRPQDARLHRQQMLLGQAQISTIHSFCLELIRSNFQKLGLPAAMRTGDEKELELLRKDCAQQVVEEFHAQGGDFLRLVELLSAGRDDSRVFSTLQQLYDFVRSHPFYQDWMREKLALYDPAVPAEQSLWGQCILNHAADALDYALEQAGQALLLIRADEAMEKAYAEAFLQVQAQLMQLREDVQNCDWDTACRRLGAFQHGRLKPLRGDDPQKARVQAIRAQIKDTVEELGERFCANREEFADDMAFLRPLVAVLFDLTQAFDRCYSEAKLQKNLIDFSDMEQYALQLLIEKDAGGYRKTLLAQSISQQYEEILVDECQDINAAQEMLFRAVSREENNLFLVGDVKQSIYRFRQACPELFMRRKKVYHPYDREHFPAKIILSKNFRSAPEITGAVNGLFSMLMSERMGEVSYDEEEKLCPGASFPESYQAGTELCLLDLSEYAGEWERGRVEAEYAAERIARMLEKGEMVSDGGRLRTARPGDICILLRSPAGRVQSYVDALTRRGVPVWADFKGNFLSSREIAPLFSFLRVLVNPLRDIDLAAAMMSVLLGFSADEMAKIRARSRKGYLWNAVLQAAEEGDGHCRQLVELVSQLRRQAACSPAETVIREIYEWTDYEAKVLAMRMGKARRDNLRLLVQYAGAYHNAGYKGLAGLIAFLDRLQERGGDLDMAQGASEQADVVRVMSIHRSKGLEFPVVFLCDCAKGFNRDDLRSSTLLHSELGFACMRRDFEQLKQYPTVPLQALRLEIERASLSEELRVLYVAMTRAKERLILTGISTKPAEGRLAAANFPLAPDGKLPPYLVQSAGSYLDWVLMAAVHDPVLAGVLREYQVEADPAPEGFPMRLRVERICDDAPLSEEEAGQLPAPDRQLVSQLQERIGFAYPDQRLIDIPTKMAVSQIAKGEAAKSHRFARRPSFLSADGMTGAQRGNALHHFMQFANYKNAKADPEKELRRMVEKGFLSAKEAESVDVKKLEAFFKSRLFGRISRAQKVYRELRFLAEAGEEVLGEYTALFSHCDGKTAVQGVADCVFIEDGQAVIVDYKSDRVKDAKELLERYRIQLELYQKILGASLGVPVKESVLYSFALSKQIVVKKEAAG